MLLEVTGALPAHVIDLFSRSSEVEVTLDMNHAPHKLTEFLYGPSPDAYFQVLQLNCLSPFSFKQGKSVRLFDARLLGGLCD